MTCKQPLRGASSKAYLESLDAEHQLAACIKLQKVVELAAACKALLALGSALYVGYDSACDRLDGNGKTGPWLHLQDWAWLG